MQQTRTRRRAEGEELLLAYEGAASGKGQSGGRRAKALCLYGKPTPALIWSLVESDDGMATLDDALAACDAGAMQFSSPLEEGLARRFLTIFRNLDFPGCEGGLDFERMPVYLPSTQHLWFGWNTWLNAAERDKVICLEAAANLFHDSFELLCNTLGPDAVCDSTRLSRAALSCCLAPVRVCESPAVEPDLFAREADLAMRAGGGGPVGEWLVRGAFSCFVEAVRTPFRCEGRIQSDAPKGVAVMDVAAPSPAFFEMLFPGAGGIDFGRLHAACCLRLAAAVAGFVAEKTRGALACPTGQLERIVVNCRDYEAADREELRTWLSLDVDTSHALSLAQAVGEDLGGRVPQSLRPWLSAAGVACETGAGLEGAGEKPGCVADNVLRVSPDAAGALSPVPPRLSCRSPEVAPPKRWKLVEADTEELPGTVAALAGCKRVCEMGCMERFARLEAWDKVVQPALRLDISHARDVLEGLRSQSDNLSVAQACSRLLERLPAGDLAMRADPLPDDDVAQLNELFVESSPLGDVVDEAAGVLEMGFAEGAGQAAEKAVSEIERLFAPLEETGYYDDDAAAVYRWFEDPVHRIVFNRFVWDGKSPVRLVPNDVYRAVNVAAILYRRLDEPQKALEMARRQTHMAPTDYDGYDTQALVLLDMSRPFEAIATMLEGAKILYTDRDCALYYYRMAYAQKNAGRIETAIACYIKAAGFDSPFSGSAADELAELREELHESGETGLDGLESSTQADAVIERDGIAPQLYGQPMEELLLSLVVSCTESGLFRTALNCLSELLDLSGTRYCDVRRQVACSLVDPF